MFPNLTCFVFFFVKIMGIPSFSMINVHIFRNHSQKFVALQCASFWKLFHWIFSQHRSPPLPHKNKRKVFWFQNPLSNRLAPASNLCKYRLIIYYWCSFLLFISCACSQWQSREMKWIFEFWFWTYEDFMVYLLHTEVAVNNIES